MASHVCQSCQSSLVKGYINSTNLTTRARTHASAVARAGESDIKLLRTVKRHVFIDALRHRKTLQGAFDAAMLHLDHPLPGTDVFLKPSDRGARAEAMYAAIEVEPYWRTLWKRTRANLPPTGREVLDALLDDWRTRPAARIAGVSQPTVDKWKKLFKKFAQCFRAWKRDFEEK